jgi:S1/P1 Nuclease
MRRTAAAILIAVLVPAAALYGWGREGHRIVADVAQERLTEVTKRNIQSLIGNNTLASVANWADQIRPERDETYNWHFVDIPASLLAPPVSPALEVSQEPIRLEAPCL